MPSGILLSLIMAKLLHLLSDHGVISHILRMFAEQKAH